MTGFIGQDYAIYLEEDFFFPSSAVDGCSAGRQEIFLSKQSGYGCGRANADCISVKSVSHNGLHVNRFVPVFTGFSQSLTCISRGVVGSRNHQQIAPNKYSTAVT